MLLPQSRGIGHGVERQAHRPCGAGGDGEQQVARARRSSADEEDRRTAEVGQREAAVRGAFPQGARRNVDAPQDLPGARTFWWSPVTKSRASTVRVDPSGAHSSYVASSATVSVIIGPAGSDMQMLPPTVAEFQTLNEDRNASQLFAKRVPAVQSPGGAKAYRSRIVHVAPISRPVAARDEGIPAQRRQVDQAAQARLLHGEQPRTAREPRIAVAPVRAGPIGAVAGRLR